MNSIPQSKFGKIYYTYSEMFYGIALKNSLTEKQDEENLIRTFVQAHFQNIAEQKSSTFCISFIKMLIQRAHMQFNNGTGKIIFKLMQFQNLPKLHQLLCEQKSLACYAKESILIKEEAGKKLRCEFVLLKYLHQQ